MTAADIDAIAEATARAVVKELITVVDVCRRLVAWSARGADTETDEFDAIIESATAVIRGHDTPVIPETDSASATLPGGNTDPKGNP